MINNFISKNKNIFKFVIMGLIGLIILFEFISLFGSFGSNAGANAGSFFSFFFFVTLLGLLLVCMIINKEEYAKFLGISYLTYFIISTLLNFGSPFYAFYDGSDGVYVAAATFKMIGGVVFVAIVVMVLIQALSKITFPSLVLDILFFAYIGCQIMCWILFLARYADINADWTSFMSLFENYLFMPCLAVIGYFYMKADTVSEQPNKDEQYVEIEDK